MLFLNLLNSQLNPFGSMRGSVLNLNPADDFNKTGGLYRNGLEHRGRFSASQLRGSAARLFSITKQPSRVTIKSLT